MKNIPKSLILETERFTLRIPNEEDFPHIFSATRYEGFNDGMLWEPPENEEELIAPLERGHKAWEKGEAYSFTVVKKGTTKLLGRISIRKTNRESVWDVGF